MTILYFDCPSGASGDMILGALLDAGVPEEIVRSSLNALDLPNWSLEIAGTTKGGIRATRASVSIDRVESPRTYRATKSLLEAAPLLEGVRERALATLEVLARAEGRVHGRAFEEVHFHEIGTTDAMVDIVGVSAALDHLGPLDVFSSAIATGTGTVTTSHGELPLPVPAVTEILQNAGASLVGKGTEELVTPTGAAILAAAGASFGELPAMRIEASGYGAGHRDLTWPNVLR
nr:LarC family nickel insertion protein [Actinomycetota bacterium]